LIIEARAEWLLWQMIIKKILPLPVAGIMSDKDGYEVSKTYQEIDTMAKQMGSKLAAPFMDVVIYGVAW